MILCSHAEAVAREGGFVNSRHGGGNDGRPGYVWSMRGMRSVKPPVDGLSIDDERMYYDVEYQ